MAIITSGATKDINTVNWSTTDENDNVYPKYWIQGDTLTDGVKIYKQESASVKKPGVLLKDTNNLIQKDNFNLYSTNSYGALTKLKECNISAPVYDTEFVARLNIGGKYQSQYSVVKNAQYYNDIAEVEIELNNPAYADQTITITGQFRTQKLYEYGESVPFALPSGRRAPHAVDTKDARNNTDGEWMYDRITDSTSNSNNYLHVKNQLINEAGLSGLVAEPLQGVDSLSYDKFGKGTWSKKVSFDNLGNAKIRIWAYRGARAYRVHLTVDGAYSKWYWTYYDEWINRGYSSAVSRQKVEEKLKNELSSKVFQWDANLILNVMSMVRYTLSVSPQTSNLWQDFPIDGAIIKPSFIRQGASWNLATVTGSYQTKPAGNIIKHNSELVSPDSEGYLLMKFAYDINNVFPFSYNKSLLPTGGTITDRTEAWASNAYTFSIKSNNGFDDASMIINEYKTNIEISRSELYGSDGYSERNINDYTFVGVDDPIRAAGRAAKATN